MGIWELIIVLHFVSLCHHVDSHWRIRDVCFAVLVVLPHPLTARGVLCSSDVLHITSQASSDIILNKSSLHSRRTVRVTSSIYSLWSHCYSVTHRLLSCDNGRVSGLYDCGFYVCADHYSVFVLIGAQGPILNGLSTLILIGGSVVWESMS